MSVHQTMARSATGADVLAARHWRSAETLLCAGTLASLGLRVYLPSHVPLGLVPTLATAPLWLRVVPAYRFGRLLAVLTATAIVFGLGLSVYASSTRTLSRQDLASNLSFVLLTFCGAAVVLWGRRLMGSRSTALLVALGMLAGAAIRGPSGDLDLWKGGLATPTIVLVLACTYGRAHATIVVLVALAIVSTVFDTRAQAIVLLLCALVVAWQRRPRSAAQGLTPTLRTSAVWTAVVLSGLGFLAYQVGTQALVRGYLGREAQERSIEQINRAGSLILGGRPEGGATLALMRTHFSGYGFGILPSNLDLVVAKQGLASINYDPNNGYVERFMFGTGFELHSVIGDLWVRMGPAGLLLVLAVAVLLVRGVAERMPQRVATGLLLFTAMWTSWNLLFSPLLDSGTTLTLAVGLALLPATARPDSPELCCEEGTATGWSPGPHADEGGAAPIRGRTP